MNQFEGEEGQEIPQLPQCFLHSLNEFSTGGFLYFRIDEFGQIEPVYSFDNEACMLSLISYAKKYIKLIDRAADQKVRHEFLSASTRDDETDEE